VLIVLWAHYLRHTPRGRLILLQGWFVLIGISVLTTYQHHFIDVPAGMLLGFLCLWFWDHLIVRQLSVVEIIALIGLRNQRVKNHGSK
jgi:membrane-associated phospholipid phosphatase